ncbi:MAG: hypothetical protein ABIK89_09010 [Planctomycetota bacterium]
MKPESTTLTGAGFTVTVDGAASLTAFGEGGDDLAKLYDSPGDPALVDRLYRVNDGLIDLDLLAAVMPGDSSWRRIDQ